MIRSSVLACLLLLAVAWPASALQDAAQTSNLFRLEPRTVEGIEQGKAALVMGEVGDAPHRFFLENLNMLVPVVVTLRPGSADADLKLAVTKYAWDQPLRQADVRDGKQAVLKFRTQGEFQVSVAGARPDTPYKLLVWVGDEVEPDLKPVVVTKAAYDKREGGGASPVLWIIALALLGILAALTALVLKKRKPS